MKNIILIVILIILVFGLGILFGSKIKKKKTGSLTRAWQARTEKKEENKKRILEKLQEAGKITNDEAQKLLDIADSTATNYLEELEKGGKIEQVGGAQKDTFYRLRKT